MQARDRPHSGLTCVLTACRCAKGSSSSSRRAAPGTSALTTDLLDPVTTHALTTERLNQLPRTYQAQRFWNKRELETKLDQQGLPAVKQVPREHAQAHAHAHARARARAHVGRYRPCCDRAAYHRAIMPAFYLAISPSGHCCDLSTRRCSTRWPSASPSGRTRASTSCAPSSAFEYCNERTLQKLKPGFP